MLWSPTSPVGTQPEAGNFPARNEIIAGITLGTLVIEADKRSGALITAKSALHMDREVFAVPGAISSPGSAGCNWLIQQQGAKLATSAQDILDELNIERTQRQANILPHVAVERRSDKNTCRIGRCAGTHR